MNPGSAAAAAAGLTLVLSLALPVAVKPLLRRLGVVDIPNERSSHKQTVIRGMGLAVLLAMCGGAASAALAAGPGPDRSIMLACAAVFAAGGLLGWLEDLRGVRVLHRAVLQLGIGAAGTALLAALTGASPWWIPAGAVAVAAYMNVANFMDGINGISGLHGLFAGAFYCGAGLLADEAWLAVLGAVLAAGFAGFLPWNLSRGAVFLGDVGSYLLGSAVAVLAAAAFLTGIDFEILIAPALIYLADTASTLLKRMLRGERWYLPHRQHVYQRLTDCGLSHLQSSLLVLVLSAAAAGGAVLASADGAGYVFAGVAACALAIAAYLSLPRLLAGRATRRAAAA